MTLLHFGWVKDTVMDIFLPLSSNTKFILNKQLQVELAWNMNNQQIKINEINYYVLSSPNKYIGDINWILKL